MKTIRCIICAIIFPFFIQDIYAQKFDLLLAATFQNVIDSKRIANNIIGITASGVYPGRRLWKGVADDSVVGVPFTSAMEIESAYNTKLLTDATY